MHPDDSFATPRTTAMVYYPNDDYEGGELEFIHFGVKIKPKAGQLFLFPAAYSYEHKIHPVTDGNYRITLVSFFNQMTEQEKRNRLSLLDQNNFYRANLQYVFRSGFSRAT
jgi:predicted 2-oxoglutarate/Fe(II)-dependent dioxygenase YbiX